MIFPLPGHRRQLPGHGAKILAIAAAREVGGLRVVNDFAERGVALMEEFNLALTKDEDQKQSILQVVEAHRARFPDANKATVTLPR
jgi:hypothetical protein